MNEEQSVRDNRSSGGYGEKKGKDEKQDPFLSDRSDSEGVKKEVDNAGTGNNEDEFNPEPVTPLPIPKKKKESKIEGSSSDTAEAKKQSSAGDDIVFDKEPTPPSSDEQYDMLNGDSDYLLQGKNLHKRRRVRLKRGKEQYLSLGIGVPTCGFAVGLIRGRSCLSTSESFFWLNIPIKYVKHLRERLALGVGLTPSIIYFAGGLGLLGYVTGEVRYYAVLDWLYLKFSVHMGFPLLFALGFTMGHSVKVGDRVHLFLENQFILMLVAGIYGMWQPVLGVAIKLGKRR